MRWAFLHCVLWEVAMLLNNGVRVLKTDDDVLSSVLDACVWVWFWTWRSRCFSKCAAVDWDHCGVDTSSPGSGVWDGMQNLGSKVSEVQTQVSGWMDSMRRSLQDALEFVSGALERDRAMDEDEDRTRGFDRAISPLRSLASRGRQSLRNLSQRSRQHFSLRRRTTTTNPNSVRHTNPLSVLSWEHSYDS